MDFYSKNPCPICKTNHPPQKLDAPIRKTPWDKFGDPPQASIRLICYVNKELNKRFKQSLPYSVTILPSFISPYSRHTVKQVTTAIANYANNRTKNIVEAAYDMGAENEKTF